MAAMQLTSRPSFLVCLAAFALNCGSVSTLSVDAASDKDAGHAGSSGGGSAGSGAGGTAGGSAGSGGSGHAGAAGGSAGGAAGGSAGAGGSGHAGAGGGSAGSGGAGGQGGSGGVCAVACVVGRSCCGGACVNVSNDPMNCGTCGVHCDGAKNLCSGGTCVKAACGANIITCGANSLCCGNGCCGPGSLCCESDGPVAGTLPSCFTPTADQPTCPQGCAPLCKSDRNQKKNIEPVDTAAILEKVGRLPISAWTYTKEPPEVRHLGPMAQDFRATFGLGDDDRTYFAVDAQGVALAAIQALNERVMAQAARIEKLERENRALARRLEKAGQ
jgi:hypothetical protein